MPRKGGFEYDHLWIHFVCIEEVCYPFSEGDSIHDMNKGKRRSSFRGIPNLMIKAHAYGAYATELCRPPALPFPKI